MSEKIATREAYGKALVELGEQNKNVVVLDADLAGATMTKFFKAAHPDRFFDCGIAEANMMNIGAGLSTMGLIPFCSTFASAKVALRASLASAGTITVMPGISRIRPMSSMDWWLPPSSPTETPAWEQQIFTLNLG